MNKILVLQAMGPSEVLSALPVSSLISSNCCNGKG